MTTNSHEVATSRYKAISKLNESFAPMRDDPWPVVDCQNSGLVLEALEERVMLAASPLTEADRAELRAWWDGDDAVAAITAPAAFDAALLADMLDGPTRFYFSRDSLVDRIDFIEANLPEEVAEVTARADEILAGRFPDQTSSTPYTVALPEDFSWLAQPDSTDNPEFVYNLNRHLFWPELALAYRFTGQAKYATELIDQINSWSDQNPPLENPDDWRAERPRWWLLDAAFRANVWPWVYQLMAGTPVWSASTNALFVHRLMQHGQFLRGVTPRPAELNWTALHATGLLSIATVLPDIDPGGQWRGYARSLLFKAIPAQFRADGGHIEQATRYHDLPLSWALEAYRLDAANGRAWPKAAANRLKAGVDALYQLLQPDGTKPAISDTFRLSGQSTINTAALAFNSTRWIAGRPGWREVLLFGINRTAPHLAQRPDPRLTNRGAATALADSGYSIARSGGEIGARQIILDAGSTGGTHGHLDLLNFELYGYGKPLVADPGLYRYDGSADRKWAIGTPSHNTISLDDANHAAVADGDDKVVVDEWAVAADHVRFTAHHNAYGDLSGQPVVARSVWYDRKNTLLVVDWAAGGRAHTAKIAFNLSGSAVSAISGDSIRTTSAAGNVQIQSLRLPGQTLSRGARRITHDPPPDHRSPAVRFAVSQRAPAVTFATLISVYSGSQPPATSATLVAQPVPGGPVRIRLTIDGSARTITFTPPAAVAARVSSGLAAPPAPPREVFYPLRALINAMIDPDSHDSDFPLHRP